MPELGFSTQQVHGGVSTDREHGARVAPLHLSAGFVFDDFDQAEARFAGTVEGYSYTRLGNPTTAAVERRIALLEGGTEALLVGTGQAAVTVAALSLLQAGDHVVSANSIYEGTRNLFQHNFARLGITVDFVLDAADPAAWARAITPSTRFLFGEGIPNPKNDLLDIPLVAEVAHAHGLPLMIDSTLATPYLQRPLELGADVVVHSASKFLAGHGTALGGAIVTGGGFDWAASSSAQLIEPDPFLAGASFAERHGRRAFIAYARDVVAARLGPAPAPFNAHLIGQGIETLSLRVERQSATALAVARWLETRDEVESVDHAGLASSPSHALARRLLPRGQGSVFAFTLRGGLEAARRCSDALVLFSRMTHLGDVRSLVLHPATTTHAHRSPEQLHEAGIGPGLLRLSIGVEDPDDLLADLEQALATIPARGAAVTP
ncbi:O-acetylhomoserine aminocarboxypropyltransferase/cysteine synthase family protein [Amnibacterium endophyticum]|uniref:O-acetylhomoserine aminocarboxypropyltransferase/cysteine synthase family protein n=1 Tax=Amnibacterium endophyticum TaxID=2109337 RepID=A0ABW4LGX0_9MICO